MNHPAVLAPLNRFGVFYAGAESNRMQNAELSGVVGQVFLYLLTGGPFRIVFRHRKIRERVRITGVLGGHVGVAVGRSPYSAQFGFALKDNYFETVFAHGFRGDQAADPGSNNAYCLSCFHGSV